MLMILMIISVVPQNSSNYYVIFPIYTLLHRQVRFSNQLHNIVQFRIFSQIEIQRFAFQVSIAFKLSATCFESEFQK